MADDSKKTGNDPQGGAAPPFTPQDALEFMQRMWNPLGIAMPAWQDALARHVHAVRARAAVALAGESR